MDFNLNAPEFFDFTENHEEENVDDYFRYVHEDPLTSVNLGDNGHVLPRSQIYRRSMSSSDISYLEAALNSDDISRRLRGNDTTLDIRDAYPSNSDQAPVNEPKVIKKSISQESVNRLAKPKHHVSHESIHNKYVSVAEAVRNFHRLTPARFHGKHKTDFHQRIEVRRETTIPKSPHFSTIRHRPVDALTREEKEWQEFQEQQKFKIKAHPLNMRVLKGPIKPAPIEKKPTTVPEPFKLTSVPHKIARSPQKPSTKFRAQPVPRVILEPPQSKFPLLRTQKPKVAEPVPEKSHPKPQVSTAPRRTIPLPFSFEVRNRYIQKKRDKLIRKVLEDERKAREFHANPVPKAVLEPPKVDHPKIKAQKSSDNNLNTNNSNGFFKAKPATVLHKKPFVPIKPQRRLQSIENFTLHLDLRAEKREAFQNHLKEREAQQALEKQLEEMRLKEKEQEEVKKLRKMTEYKAQPVKKYKEIIIQPSGVVTIPVTPNFQLSRKERKHRQNNENEIL